MRFTIARLVLVLGLSLFAIGSQGQQSPQIVFMANYENGNPTSGVSGLNASGPQAADALTVDCSAARTGKCSVVSQIRMDPSYVSAGAHRAETSTSRIPATLYGPGDHFRYRFSVNLDASWQADGRDAIEMVWQFKRFGTHPDMFVAVKGQTLVWRITDQKQITLTRDLPRGEWLDFEFDVRWSTREDGLARLLLSRGGQSASFVHEGPNLRDGRANGGYLKWGLYKPGQLDRRDAFLPRIVRHDDIEVARLH